VIDATLGTENWDLKGLGITETKIDFEKPLWIPLDELDNIRELGVKAVLVNADLRQKLDSANEILAEIEIVGGSKILVNNHEFDLLLERLHKVLKTSS
jgi:predicted peroxiredoxin